MIIDQTPSGVFFLIPSLLKPPLPLLLAPGGHWQAAHSLQSHTTTVLLCSCSPKSPGQITARTQPACVLTSSRIYLCVPLLFLIFYHISSCTLSTGLSSLLDYIHSPCPPPASESSLSHCSQIIWPSFIHLYLHDH